MLNKANRISPVAVGTEEAVNVVDVRALLEEVSGAVKSRNKATAVVRAARP